MKEDNINNVKIHGKTFATHLTEKMINFHDMKERFQVQINFGPPSQSYVEQTFRYRCIKFQTKLNFISYGSRIKAENQVP